MPSHETITDPNIHEPKGISSASEGMVYVSDGNGSGSWIQWPYGQAFYQNNATGQSITSTPSKVTINGLGLLSNTSKLPREIRGVSNLWDTVNNKITPIRLYDVYQVRVDIPVTAETGSPTELRVQFDIGNGVAPSTVILQKFFPTGKTVPYIISFDTSIAVLSNTTLVNGIQLFLNTNTGTLTLGSPGILISKTVDGNL